MVDLSLGGNLRSLGCILIVFLFIFAVIFIWSIYLVSTDAIFTEINIDSVRIYDHNLITVPEGFILKGKIRNNGDRPVNIELRYILKIDNDIIDEGIVEEQVIEIESRGTSPFSKYIEMDIDNIKKVSYILEPRLI